MNASRTYAVLTGDLVRSTRLSADQSAGAMQWLREAADTFDDAHPDTLVGELSSFRHDSWQLLLGRPEQSVRAALFLRARLIRQSDSHTKYDTRIAIGIGTVERLDEARISDSRGPAFTLSGKALDALSSHRLAFASADPVHGALSYAVAPLLDDVVSSWTPAEALAISGALRGWTQKAIAEDAGSMTQQAVSDALDRARWHTVKPCLDWLTEHLQQT